MKQLREFKDLRLYIRPPPVARHMQDIYEMAVQVFGTATATDPAVVVVTIRSEVCQWLMLRQQALRLCGGDNDGLRRYAPNDAIEPYEEFDVWEAGPASPAFMQLLEDLPALQHRGLHCGPPLVAKSYLCPQGHGVFAPNAVRPVADSLMRLDWPLRLWAGTFHVGFPRTLAPADIAPGLRVAWLASSRGSSAPWSEWALMQRSLDVWTTEKMGLMHRTVKASQAWSGLVAAVGSIGPAVRFAGPPLEVKRELAR